MVRGATDDLRKPLDVVVKLPQGRVFQLPVHIERLWEGVEDGGCRNRPSTYQHAPQNHGFKGVSIRGMRQHNFLGGDAGWDRIVSMPNTHRGSDRTTVHGWEPTGGGCENRGGHVPGHW